MKDTEASVVGRNEPCPCRSGKKYKRCCGVDAAPKLSAPAALAPGGPAGLPPGFDPSQMDPQWMAQVGQAMRRLPKGQLQQMQKLMQRAMAGKDVTQEMADLQSKLPQDLQQTLMAASGMMGQGPAPATPEATSAVEAASEPPSPASMTPEQARQIVADAVARGELTREQADAVLKDQGSEGQATPEAGVWGRVKGLFTPKVKSAGKP